MCPPLVDPDSLGRGQNITKTWFDYVRLHPVAFYSFCFAAFCHNHARQLRTGSTMDRSQNGNMRYALFCQTQALQLIRENLSDPMKMASDTTILSIMLLSSHSWDVSQETQRQTSGNTFNRPLADRQWIDVYSTFISADFHAVGLLTLIDLRGGLKQIEFPKLGALLS
jgi:hypothetical protein